ncbi:MAG TPA: hypothetical protein DCO70_00185 [Verrucomicrobiales bacterium]|nr:hypothetical protein [Verrucomicrobiales bacterium]
MDDSIWMPSATGSTLTGSTTIGSTVALRPHPENAIAMMMYVKCFIFSEKIYPPDRNIQPN